jgi:hypothetical protein
MNLIFHLISGEPCLMLAALWWASDPGAPLFDDQTTPHVNRVRLADDFVADLARIPGTSSLWAARFQPTKTSSDTVIWAHGWIG